MANVYFNINIYQNCSGGAGTGRRFWGCGYAAGSREDVAADCLGVTIGVNEKNAVFINIEYMNK